MKLNSEKHGERRGRRGRGRENPFRAICRISSTTINDDSRSEGGGRDRDRRKRKEGRNLLPVMPAPLSLSIDKISQAAVTISPIAFRKRPL